MTQYVIRNPNNPIVRDLYKDIPLVDSQGNVVTDSEGRIICDRYVVRGSVGISEEAVDTKIQNLGSNFVDTTSTQTVGGNKSFSGTVTVTTPTKTVDGQTVTDTDDNTTKVANTKFVQAVKSELSADISNIAEKSNAITVSDTAPNVANMPIASGVMHPSQDIITEDPDVSILALQQDMWGYKSDKSYTVDEYVLYQGNIYKCIQDNTITVDGETTHIAPTDSNYWIKFATLADLVSKADKDFININNTAKIAIAHNAMPSDKYDDLTLGASGTDYTAPADGYVFFSKAATAVGQWIVIASENLRTETSSPISSTYGLRIFLPVRKGEIFNITYSATGATSFFRFVYAIGSESEQQV